MALRGGRKSVSRFSSRSTSGSFRLSARSPICSTPICVMCVSRDTDMTVVLNNGYRLSLRNGSGNGTQEAQKRTQKAQEISFVYQSFVLLVFFFVLFVFLPLLL